MSTLETWYRSTLAAKLNATDITITVATAPTRTAWRMHIYRWSTHAWIKYTWLTGTTLTGVTFVSQTADPATSVTGVTFPAWTSIELVEMHDQMYDKQAWGTIPGATYFSNSLKVPVYADATARDAAITSPANGMEVYLTAEGYFTDYQWSVWWARDTGTVTANASTTVAGKVELPTTAEMTSWSATGWTGAWLAVTPALLQSYYNFWDGSSGAATISGNTSLSADMFYTDLTVNTGITLNPAGYAIYVSGTLTLTGTAKISRLGNNGTAWTTGASGAGAAGGAWGTALTTGSCGTVLGGAAGGAGNNAAAWSAWVAGTAVATSYTNITSAASGAGGAWVEAAWAAWATAVATRWALYNVLYDNWKLLALLSLPSRGISSTTYGGSPSAWGGGGGGWHNAWGGYSGGGGGWSGGNGWNILVFANILAWSGTIEAAGGVWWAGWNGNWTGVTGWGGGGAGWCGGVIVLCYKTGTPFTTVVTGGAGGAWGTAPGGGVAGSAGATGTAWATITIQAT